MDLVRTMEIGRAVLASSTHHLELWLTTLITILPSQHSIEIQQLSPHSLIALLSSGIVWVSRGNGMHVKVEITLRGEALPQQQLQGLTDSILAAPIWAQLNLEPTLPTDAAPQGRTVQININHNNYTGSSEVSKMHRMFFNVPAADVQPPDRVPKFELKDVRFCMDILEPKRRPQSKRSKTSPVECHQNQHQYDGVYACGKGPDAMLHKMVLPTRVTNVEDAVTVPSPTNRKRKRLEIYAPTRINPSAGVFPNRSFHALRNTAMTTAMTSHVQSIPLEDEVAELHSMVDGAIRLSICGLNKAPNGLKVKANTFGVGLADAAPNLWRPGYLVALSQRAHLLPTITHSFRQMAEVRVISVSLIEKFQRLTALPFSRAYESQQNPSPSTDSRPGGRLSSSISCRLWLHLQNNLSHKPTPPLLAFVAQNAKVAKQSDSDEILDDENPTDEIDDLDALGIEDFETACLV